MALSRITLTFNEDLSVNDFVSFYLSNASLFGGLNIKLLETWKSTRSNPNEVSITAPTANIGEASAINFVSSFLLDFGGSGFLVTRNVNVVRIVVPFDYLTFNTYTTNASVTGIIDVVDSAGESFAPTLTNIDSKAKIFLAESPIHFNFQNEAADASIQKVTVEVYIWRGFQTADLPTNPTVVFNNIKNIIRHFFM